MNITLLKNKTRFLSNRNEESKNLDSGVRSTYIIMSALIGGLLLYYIWILNINATLGYSIRELEREEINLMSEINILDVKIAELESSKMISSEDDLKNMEEVEEPEYLVIKADVQYVYSEK